MANCTCSNDEYETIRTCPIHGDLNHVEDPKLDYDNDLEGTPDDEVEIHIIELSEQDPFKHGHDLLRTKQLWDEIHPEIFEEDLELLSAEEISGVIEGESDV